MSSPIGSPDPFSNPTPSTSYSDPTTSTSSQATREASTEEKVLKTFELLKQILDLSIAAESESSSRSGLIASLESKFDIVVLDATAKHLALIIQKTAQNCFQIARSIVTQGINLENRLQQSHLLTRQEISLIVEELNEARATMFSKKRKAEFEASKLPVKKRFYAHITFEETLESSFLAKIKPSTLNCSEETIQILLGIIERNEGWGGFVCPKHSPDSCAHCEHLSCLTKAVKSAEELQLRGQLCELLKYTSKDLVAKCFYKHKMLLQGVLEAKPLSNHHLALILKECDIGDDICSPNLPNPKTQAEIYEDMEKIIIAGPEAPFTQAIRAIWRTEILLNQEESLSIASDETGSSLEELSRKQFMDSLPRLTRSYFFVSKGRKSKNYSDNIYSESFGRFLAKATFLTVQGIIQNRRFHYLLTETPSKELVPSKNLLQHICCLILSSNLKWKIKTLPCKASIKSRDYLHFLDMEAEMIDEDFSIFASRNEITMSGSSSLAKRFN
ncbi:hypothetical protein [Chlamydiifrater phoenicopteri]|uniref:hypothetical protein n=1 Tax=Chlamydiifrater phoenicopteri TaxID=2681469 RepID=UPI001BCCCCA6|nr:hypothetical protein [Chlamydiifrater phoenicopteri]